jgi:hypothetical protein
MNYPIQSHQKLLLALTHVVYMYMQKEKQESTFLSSPVENIHFALFNFRENSPDVIPHFVTPTHLTKPTVSF